MNHTRLAVASLWSAILPTTVFAAGPRTPDPAAAAVWLDRAQHDLESLPAEAPKGQPEFDAISMAVYLYQAGPTDARRDLVIRLLDGKTAAYVGKKESAEQVRFAYLLAAKTHAEVDDSAGARKMLAAAAAPSGAAPTTNPMVQFGSSMMESGLRAETDLLIGDKPAFEKLALTYDRAAFVADELRSIGHPDEAKIADDWYRSHITDKAENQFGFKPSSGLNRVAAATALASEKKYTEALAAAAAADTDLPKSDGDVSMPGCYGFQADVAIAKVASEAGDTANFRMAVKAAIGLLDANQQKGYFDPDTLLRVCLHAKDHDGFTDAAAAMRAMITAQRANVPSWHTYPAEQAHLLGKLALDCFVAGDNAGYQWAVDTAEHDLALPDPQNASSSERETNERCRRRDYLTLATARARAGDTTGADRDTAAALKSKPPGYDYDIEEGWSDIARVYADAGQFDQAIAAASHVDDTYGNLAAHIARREADGGKFDDAWKLIARVPPGDRVRSEYAMAVREVQAGRESAMADRVKSLSTPQEKAMVELAVGQTLVGKEFFGDLRAYRPKDE
jgi:hypothetical protein